MYGIALSFSLLALLFVMSLTVTRSASEQQQRAYVASLASNLAVYKGFAMKYVSTNPGFTGSVSDAALGLPSWYGKQENLGLYVASGRGYIYLVGNQVARVAESAGYLRDKTEFASWGLKKGGQVRTADGELLSIPSQVPEGSFVFIL